MSTCNCNCPCTCNSEAKCICLEGKVEVVDQNQQQLHSNCETIEANLDAEAQNRLDGDATLQDQINTVSIDITALDGRVTQNETDIADLQSLDGLLFDDVRRFGAVEGDQGTDTAAAMETAWATVQSASIPFGTFYIDRTAEIPDNCRLRGNGELSWNDANSDVGTTAPTASIYMVQGVGEVGPASPTRAGIRIEGVRFNGNGNNQSNMDAALAAIALSGHDHSVENCTFRGFRAGDQKETFVINLHGTKISSTNFPAYNNHVRNCKFYDGANQTLAGSSLEFTQILIAGHAIGDDPDEIGQGCSVVGCEFYNLNNNGSQNRSIHGIAPLGDAVRVEGNRMFNCAGTTHMIWIQSVNTSNLLITGNQCGGIEHAVSLNENGDEVHEGIHIRDNVFNCTLAVINFFIGDVTGPSTGSGYVTGVIIEDNFLSNPNGSPVVIQIMDLSRRGTYKIVNNTLGRDDPTWPGVIVGWFEDDVAPFDPDAYGTGDTALLHPDEFVVGDNMDTDTGRSTKRAQISFNASSGGGGYRSMTWAAHAEWPEIT